MLTSQDAESAQKRISGPSHIRELTILLPFPAGRFATITLL